MQNIERNDLDKLILSSGEMETLLCAGLRGLCVTGPDLRCRYATPLFAQTLGYDRAQLPGLPIQEVLRPNGTPLETGLIRTINNAELRLTRRDGTTFPARIHTEELRTDGISTGYAFFVRDLTEEKHVEDVLRKTEKLASAGRMAAVIAHEINNPLEAVINLLFLLRQEPLTVQGERFLSLAESEVERVSRIARQTLGFYRDTGKPVRIDVRELLNLSVDVHTMRNSHLRIHRRYRSSSHISGFPSELQQVFHNLIGNAIEAGTRDIWLHTRNLTEPAPPRREGVQITVADNGSGIESGVREKIFNPFITTKGEKGTGLGLWTSRGIIARHEGSIRVRTSTARTRSGTCFTIFLPR